MADNQNEHVVVAIFPNQTAADHAIADLKAWDFDEFAVKLGAMGTIVKHGDQIKTHVGHKTGRGAGVGAVVGLIAGVLSGGLTLLGGLLAGTAVGGGAGAFMKQSLHLTKAEIDALGTELDAGKVAVVVTCDAAEIEPTKAQLEAYGGTTRTYAVPQAALAEATQAMAVADDTAVQAESAAAEPTAPATSTPPEPTTAATEPPTAEERAPSEPPAP